jgi:archaellum biogenesis ATPase FlaH
MSEFISYNQQCDESSFIPHRPTAKVEPAEVDTVNYWTMASLEKHLANVPDHLVPGYFSWNVTCIQGVSGAGKSLIAQELVAAYTTGSKFLGIAECTVKQDRPNIGYLDQDNFSFDVLYDRLKQFGVDESKVFIPTDTLHLDNEASYTRMAKFIVQHKIGLVILDSIHAFYTFRDKQLNQLRKGFQALIDAGCAVVVLSHVVKSKRPDEIDAAQGAGLPEACDFTLSVYKTASGEMRLKPVKKRHPKGIHRDEVIVIYDGESRMKAKPDLSVEDKILQLIADAGQKGTNLGALRDLAGKDNIKAALASLDGKYYCDGKRGPGNHIWDLKYKPEVLTEESAMDLDDDNPFADDEDEAMVVSA